MITSYCDAATIATILHMDTSRCEYNPETQKVSTNGCENIMALNNNLYTSGIIPFIDMVYFTKKLDHHLNSFLASKVPNADPCFTFLKATPDKANTEINDMFGDRYRFVDDNEVVRQIVSAELGDGAIVVEKNSMGQVVDKLFYIGKLNQQGRYFLSDENNGLKPTRTITSRDMIAHGRLRAIDGLPLDNNTPMAENGEEARYCNKNANFFAYYYGTGLVSQKKYAEDWNMKDHWNAAKTEAINTMYKRMIVERGLDKVISKNEFLKNCIIAAVKDTEYHMQYVQYNNTNQTTKEA